MPVWHVCVSCAAGAKGAAALCAQSQTERGERGKGACRQVESGGFMRLCAREMR